MKIAVDFEEELFKIEFKPKKKRPKPMAFFHFS